MEEGPAFRAIQVGPLYLIQATVRPVHRSTKVVNGKSFGAYQTWKLNIVRTRALGRDEGELEAEIYEQFKKKVLGVCKLEESG